MRQLFLSMIIGIGMLSQSGFAFAQEPAPVRPKTMRVNMQNNMPTVGDFTIGPARTIISVAPGEERTVEIQLTNREGRLAAFDMVTEDFIADPDREGTPTFYADDTAGPYPAREWITPETDRFELRHGERAFLRVTIRVPEDAEPGDHQAALIFTRDVESQPVGGFNIISRVAALFIISVEGDVVQEGYVDSLIPKRYFNWFLPVLLNLSVRNEGTVHMIPTGSILIKNIFGVTVDEISVKDWVILRNSSRNRDFEWKPKFALGYYRATTAITAFDGRPLRELSTTFWAVPLLPVLTVLLAVFLVSFLVQYFSARFEIRRKGDGKVKTSRKK